MKLDATPRNGWREYRAQALKLFPWVCGRCAHTFTHSNFQLLEVHHKNCNHDDNSPDGSNWELLCTDCHEHEHSKLKDMAGRTDAGNEASASTFNPFAELKAMMEFNPCQASSRAMPGPKPGQFQSESNGRSWLLDRPLMAGLTRSINDDATPPADCR